LPRAFGPVDTTGMSMALDLGDPTAPAGSVHSRRKEEVARRLALATLHTAYAVQAPEVAWAGPHIDAVSVDAQTQG